MISAFFLLIHLKFMESEMPELEENNKQKPKPPVKTIVKEKPKPKVAGIAPPKKAIVKKPPPKKRPDNMCMYCDECTPPGWAGTHTTVRFKQPINGQKSARPFFCSTDHMLEWKKANRHLFET